MLKDFKVQFKAPIIAFLGLLVLIGVVFSVYEKPVHFFVFGDMGSGLTAQYDIANAMTKMQQKAPAQFVVMLGDNIYPVGDIKSDHSKKFEKPYAYFLEHKIPFKPVLGNHDVPHQDDQIKYFGMPGRYYSYSVGPIQFFALDTNKFNWSEQVWLEKALAASTASWKIAYAHHPIFSSGYHGNSKALDASLRPLLEKYGVQLYLAGHDHDYERLSAINGVTYIVSGGGGASIRDFAEQEFLHPEEHSVVKMVKHHYMVVDADANTLKVTVLDKNNAVLDQLTLKH